MTKRADFVDGDISEDNRIDADFLNAVLDAVWDAIGNGTDAPTTNAQVRINLSLVIGTNVQAYSALLTSLTSLYAAKGSFPVATAAATIADLAVGTNGYSLVAQSGATSGLQYLPPDMGYSILNGQPYWSASGNALTCAIKGWDGNDPSTTNPVFIVFRSATAATGSLTLRALTAATSITINDTATLGTVNSTAFKLWCAAFDDGGTVRLALINCVSGTNIYPLGQFPIASATQEDNASDSAHVFYSDGATITSKGYTVLGYAGWESGLATAGTWSAGPTRTQLYGSGTPLPGSVIQTQWNTTGAVATGTTATVLDNSIPQSGEGNQYMTQAITPTSASNILAVDSNTYGAHSVNGQCTVALFQDNTADALAAVTTQQSGASTPAVGVIYYRKLAGQTTATTFKIRAGGDAGATYTFNGSGGTRVYGGVANSYMKVEEIMT